MKRILFLALMLAGLAVYAAPPYDVTATVSAPTSGAPADGLRLYMDGVLVGEVPADTPTTFPGLITADGTYSFTATAYNAAGEGPVSTPTVVTITEIQLPGAPSNPQIQVDCSPCVIDISP